MEVNEIDKKDYPNRIEALVSYLSQGLYGQEDVIKELLLFALAKRKVEVNADDEELKNIVLNRVYAAFKEFYVDKNFSIPCSGDTLKSIYIPKIPKGNFFDFITQDIPELTPTEEQKSLLFSMDEVNAMQKEIKKIGLSDGVKRLILENRDRNHDTVWQDIVHVLQMSAFLNDRDIVYLSDFSNSYVCVNSEFWFCDIKFQKTTSGIEKKNDSVTSDFENYISENFYKDENSSIHRYGFEHPHEKENSAVKKIKNSLDNEYPIAVENLEKKLQEIEFFKTELDKPCIFMRNSNFFEALLGFTARILERTKIALKSKYEEINFPVAKDIEIGGYIFKGGTYIKHYDEAIWYDDDHYERTIMIDDFRINSLVAIICIKGSTADPLYGISQEGWTGIDFSEAQQIAESYKAKKSFVYSSDWLIPTIEQLEEIYQNREKIEQEALGYKLSGKFWSSTKKGDEAVYFFDFDKGTKDYTTPDHKYNLALVHLFGEY